jgi:hypothetical protein
MPGNGLVVTRKNQKVFPVEDRYLTFKQLRQRWGGEDVSERSIWRWVQRRGLKSLKMGGKALFSLHEIMNAEEQARGS